MHPGIPNMSEKDSAQLHIFEVPVGGMDCAECSKHVQTALESIPGVCSTTVYLAAEKAVISADPSRELRLNQSPAYAPQRSTSPLKKP